MADVTCKHEGCTCPAPDGEYCSDYCRQHADHPGQEGHDCGCGHPGFH